MAGYPLIIHDIQSEPSVTGLAIRPRPTGVVGN